MLDNSVMWISNFFPIAPIRVALHLFSLPSCPCVWQIIFLQAHLLSAHLVLSPHSLQPSLFLEGLRSFLNCSGPWELGTCLLLGKGKTCLWLGHFANLFECKGPHLWQFPRYTRKKLLLMPQCPCVSTLCRASELLPLPSTCDASSNL